MADEPILATGAESRAIAQSADILVGDARTLRAAMRWVHRHLLRYPGCLVAAARTDDGAWLVVASRGRGTTLRLSAIAGDFDAAKAGGAARLRYERIVRS